MVGFVVLRQKGEEELLQKKSLRTVTLLVTFTAVQDIQMLMHINMKKYVGMYPLLGYVSYVFKGN